MPVLTKNLEKLRTECNILGPSRDKSTDGWIGDAAHAGGTSGHNWDDSIYDNAEWDGDSDTKQEVRAIDVDASGPWRNGQTTEKIVQHLVKKGREGNLETVIRYIIFKSRIWRASTGWVTESYSGANSHDLHFHASGAWTNAADENDEYNYGIANLGAPVVMADANVISFSTGARDVLTAEATEGVLSYAGGGLPSWTGQPTNRNFLNAFSKLFAMVQELTTAVEDLSADNSALQADLAFVKSKINELEHDPADGGPSTIQQAVGAAVWLNPTRTLSA